MALSHGLASAGHTPTRASTSAKLHLEKRPEGFRIPLIELDTETSRLRRAYPEIGSQFEGR
jgi:hypothetical protein